MFSKAFSKLAFQGKRLTHLTKKNFDMHEYIAKEIMEYYKINVQKGSVATTPWEARIISSKLNNSEGLVVKAQVHAGGRGKGQLTSGYTGGVQMVKTEQEVENSAEQMLGFNLITKQTPKAGLKVNAVLVVEAITMVRQIYFAILLDRNTQGPCIVVCNEGGVEIETIAKINPNAVMTFPINPHEGITDTIIYQLAVKLGLQAHQEQVKEQVSNLYKCFTELDCTQLEINPWGLDLDNNLVCVDTKMKIDDNANFRQKKLTDLRKSSLGSEDVDPYEEKAQAADLSYVALGGNIGCMVNGAGLAMATMDIIKLYGAEPANFLDVGGGASADQVATAFDILMHHPHVKVIYINIFGGILSCKTLAEGIVQAIEQSDLTVPLVVRLYGNQFEEAKELLSKFQSQNPQYQVIVAEDMQDGAKKASEIATEQVSKLRIHGIDKKH